MPRVVRTVAGTVVPAIFPLTTHSTGRYLIDAQATPRPPLLRTGWNSISLPTSQYRQFMNDTLAKEFTGIELAIPHRDLRSLASPFAGNGAAPFLKTLAGSNWTGSFSYSNINNDAPDFSTPNSSYWGGHVDNFITWALRQRLMLHLFGAYVGFTGSTQGWLPEMVANGTTKMQTYGAFIAGRYKEYGHLVWMLGGDKGTNANNFTTQELAVVNAYNVGLLSVSSQMSTYFSAEWDSPSLATDQTSFGILINFNGTYDWTANVEQRCRDGYARNPILPSYLDEGPYDEEGPDGNNVNPNATQPVRRFSWRSFLATGNGYTLGNGAIWLFNSGYHLHFSTRGQMDCQVLNRYIKSIQWWRLIPDGLGSIGTLVSSGAGSIDSDSRVCAACTSLGDLMVVHAGVSATNFSINMAKFRGIVTARWINPINGTPTAVGTFTNSGVHQFTNPGSNGDNNDFVLELTA